MATKKEERDLKAGKLSPADARRVKRELAEERQAKAEARSTKKPRKEKPRKGPLEIAAERYRREIEEDLSRRWQEAEKAGDLEALEACRRERYALITERSDEDLEREADERRKAHRLARIAEMKAFLDRRDRGRRKLARRTGTAPPLERYHPEPHSAAALGLAE